MPDGTEPVRTFRFKMQNIPVLQVALDIIDDQPEELSKMAGVDLNTMAEDLLVQLLRGQQQAFQRHLDSPLGPDQQAPKVEVDLDRAEAIGLAHLVIAVRQGHEGEYERLLLRAIAEYFVQLPDEWVESANEPLPELVNAVKNHVRD